MKSTHDYSHDLYAGPELPTPGPWTVLLGMDATVVASDGRTFDIGDVVYHSENISNAHLIAAAPDLLAACKAALALIELEIADPEDSDACHGLRAALAKAEGRQL